MYNKISVCLFRKEGHPAMYNMESIMINKISQTESQVHTAWSHQYVEYKRKRKVTLIEIEVE